MDYSKRENTNRRLLSGNYGEKLYSRVWIYALRIMCVCFLAVCFAGAGALLGTFMGMMDGVPEITLDALHFTGETSRIVDKDGNLLAEIRTAEQRTQVPIEQMPKQLIQATVAAEDHRFFEHDGIDLEGILRAGVANLRSGGTSQGGSTITQQMIKKLVLTSDQNWKRKIQEWYLALKLESMMNEVYGKERTKELILESYLNYNYLGNSCYGVEAASQRYFGKHVQDLTLSECALIAGLFNAPSAYDPIVNYNGVSRERQIIVLEAMKAYGYITQSEYDTAAGDQIFVRIRAYNEKYYANLEDDVYSYFVDSVITQVQDDLVEKLGYTENEAYNTLYYGGLTVYATQDSRIQAIVDEVFADPEMLQADTYYELNYSLTVYDEKDRNITDNYWTYGLFAWEEDALAAAAEYRDRHITEGMEKGIDYVESIVLTEEPQYSMTIIDQHTGHVVGMCGGRGKKTTNLSLNRATDSTRQPGSTFKVIASYSAALDVGGFCCASSMDDAPMHWGDWTPENWWGSSYLGAQTMREGLAHSENVVTARFMRAVGIETNFEYAKSYGFTTLREEPDEWGNTDMVGSLCLGSGAIKNIELCGAYAAIANSGVYIHPTVYTKIIDSDGNLFFEYEPETHRVIKETTAYMLADMMRDVITGASGGTSPDANFDWDMFTAAKSGTTSSDNDYAFVGFTPYYTCAIQVGFDYVSYPEIYYESLGTYSIDPNGARLLSSSAHKRIWREVMRQIHEPLETISSLPMPEGLTYVTLCKDSGKLPNEYCSKDPRGSRLVTDLCAVDSIPYGVCNRHIQLRICSESGHIATQYCTETKTQVFLTRTEEEIAEIGKDYLSRIADFEYCAYPIEYASSKNSSTNNSSGTIYEDYKPKYIGECQIHIYKPEETSVEESSSESSPGGDSSGGGGGSGGTPSPNDENAGSSAQ